MHDAPSHSQRALYWLLWHALLVAFTLLYRLRIHHKDRIPRAGPLLIAANHQSHLDPPAIGMACASRPLHFIAREGLFKNRLFAWLITALNSIPISETQGENDLPAIRAILARLQTGVPVLIFPEGSRSPDGNIHAFKRGVALLLKRARCPVVPVAIHGAYDAFPRHNRFPRPFGRIEIMIGEPIPADELLKDGPDAGLDRLRDRIIALHRALQRRTTPSDPPPIPAADPL